MANFSKKKKDGVTAEYPATWKQCLKNGGYVATQLRGYAVKWLRGYSATQLSGYAATRLSDYVATQLRS